MITVFDPTMSKSSQSSLTKRAAVLNICRILLFTPVHGMQTRSSDKNSVRLSNACIVTKRKKAMFKLLYHTKEHLGIS